MRRIKLYEKTRWRFLLILISLIVVAASISYTNTVANQLKEDELKNVKLWADAQTKTFQATDLEYEYCDFTLHSMILEKNSDIPVILTDEYKRIIDARNFDNRDIVKDSIFFRKEIERLSKIQTPITIGDENFKNYIYYRQSTIITSLEWFPYFQFAILGVLILISYFTFSLNRQAEQERVWVGMAKETAHQLGTPITSLMGWVENFKIMYPEDENMMMMCEEMNLDIELLKLVANRFEKIGTIPVLESRNIYENLQKHHNYVKQRASRKITFDFPENIEYRTLNININPLLFDWVIENLLKNALDAMEGKGKITATVQEDEQYVYIDVTDSGKGIAKRKFKSVFQPGYSTKKRGWGLGLSLCKRIVEKYHNGKIFVLSSVEGKGTTFRIRLPQAKKVEST